MVLTWLEARKQKEINLNWYFAWKLTKWEIDLSIKVKTKFKEKTTKECFWAFMLGKDILDMTPNSYSVQK